MRSLSQSNRIEKETTQRQDPINLQIWTTLEYEQTDKSVVNLRLRPSTGKSGSRESRRGEAV